MTGRTHDLAAFTALSVVVLAHPYHNYTLSTVLIGLLANQIGGVAPDIDQPTAPLWRNLPIGGVFGKMFGDLSGGHRFLTHSLIGVALAGYAAKSVLAITHPLTPHLDTGYVWWAFMIGMISHLCMDSFTKEGVPWLLPVPYKFGFPPLRRLRLTTGKLSETLLIFPGLLALTIWLYASHYQQLLQLLHRHIS